MGYRNEFLSKYGHADHLHKIIDDRESGDHYSNMAYVVKNPVLDHTHLTKIIPHASSHVKGIIASHPDIKDSHVDQLMGDQSYNVNHVKEKVMANPKVTTHAIKKAFDDCDRETQKLIGKNRHLPKELRKHVLDNSHDPEVHQVINSRIKSDKDLDDFMDDVHKDPILASKKS